VLISKARYEWRPESLKMHGKASPISARNFSFGMGETRRAVNRGFGGPAA